MPPFTEPNTTAYGLETLWDPEGGTAEVEYAMTRGTGMFHELMILLMQYRRSSRSEWPPEGFLYRGQRRLLAEQSPPKKEPQYTCPLLWV